MSDLEPIQLTAYVRREVQATQPGIGSSGNLHATSGNAVVAFTRQELSAVLATYGRLQAEGEARDYAMDFGREKAVFSIFRRASEIPLYRIEKVPKSARRQGAYSVVTPTGLILKRGHDLARVLEVLGKRVRVVR